MPKYRVSWQGSALNRCYPDAIDYIIEAPDHKNAELEAEARLIPGYDWNAVRPRVSAAVFFDISPEGNGRQTMLIQDDYLVEVDEYAEDGMRLAITVEEVKEEEDNG